MTVVAATDSVRVLERDSIRAFMHSCARMFTGRVLDYGCGRQPYRHIIEAAGGDYTGFDRPQFPGSLVKHPVGRGDPLNEKWDAIVCNQVLQYIHDVPALLDRFHEALNSRCVLVLTGPTNWPEVEAVDLHRFTISGIEQLLREAGFYNLDVESRATVEVDGVDFSLGYGAVGRCR